MQLWAILGLAFALVVAIGAFALAMAELRVIERVEEQKWQDFKEKIAEIR